MALGTAAASMPSGAEARPFPRFGRVRDLTPTLTSEFPTFFGVPGIGMKQIKEFKKDGFNLMEWTVLEHSGTHIDTPIHFSESGAGPDTLAVDDLLVPLAVFNAAEGRCRLPAHARRHPAMGTAPRQAPGRLLRCHARRMGPAPRQREVPRQGR